MCTTVYTVVVGWVYCSITVAKGLYTTVYTTVLYCSTNTTV